MTIERFFSAHLYRSVMGKDGKPKLEKIRVKDGYRTYGEAKNYARSSEADAYNIQSYAIITE